MLPARKITMGDVLVWIAALLFCLLLVLRPLFAEKGAFCVLQWEEGEQRYSLYTEQVISVESGGYSLTVTIVGGTAAITASDCPDQVCVHTGAVSKNGQASVCVPAGVILRIADAAADGEDFRVG